MSPLRSRRASAMRLSLVVAGAVALMGAACNKGDGARTTATANGETTRPAAGKSDTSVTARADEGRLAGDAAAKVWMIEISDFQCPYCKMWHDSTYATIRREYVDNGKVRLAYVNMPLSMHQNAPAAAEAAMCASVQGKFWPLHEALFDSQERWAKLSDPMPVFAELATKAGVDATRWRACVDQHETRALIAADAQRAEQAGIRSTPTFIIGSQMIEGAYPVETFRAALDSALAKAARPAPAGT